MEEDFTNIKQRILHHLNIKGLSKRNFYLKTGISNGVLDKTTGLSEDSIVKYLKSFPEINPIWVILGSGKMFVEEENKIERNINLIEEIGSLKKEDQEKIFATIELLIKGAKAKK